MSAQQDAKENDTLNRIAPIFLLLCMLVSLLTVGVSVTSVNRDKAVELEDGYYLVGTHNGWAPGAYDLLSKIRTTVRNTY